MGGWGSCPTSSKLPLLHLQSHPPPTPWFSPRCTPALPQPRPGLHGVRGAGLHLGLQETHPFQIEAPYQAKGHETTAAGPGSSGSGATCPRRPRGLSCALDGRTGRVSQTSPAPTPPPPPQPTRLLLARLSVAGSCWIRPWGGAGHEVGGVGRDRERGGARGGPGPGAEPDAGRAEGRGRGRRRGAAARGRALAGLAAAS